MWQCRALTLTKCGYIYSIYVSFFFFYCWVLWASCAFSWIRLSCSRLCISSRDQLLAPELYRLYWHGNQTKPKLLNVSGYAYCSHLPLQGVHQSVSVGHYLLHPNNREFSWGTRQALANHRLRVLLLTLDLSTHTMLRPYISTESSESFFFSFTVYPKRARKQKLWL